MIIQKNYLLYNIKKASIDTELAKRDSGTTNVSTVAEIDLITEVPMMYVSWDNVPVVKEFLNPPHSILKVEHPNYA